MLGSTSSTRGEANAGPGTPYLDPTNARYLGLLLLIVLLGAASRLFHFYEAMGSDDQRWIITAGELGGERGSGVTTPYYSRILFRVVLRAWGEVWGLNLKSSAALMFLLSAATTVFVASAARRMFGSRAALLAATLYATDPFNVTFDVLTLPDGLASTLLSISVWSFVKFLGASRGGVLSLMLAGLLAGLAFSAKEYYLFVLGPFALAVWARGGRISTRLGLLSLLAVAAALGLSADLFLHRWDSGNLLGHFAPLANYHERLAAVHEGSSGLGRLLRILKDRIAYPVWFAEYDPIYSMAYLAGLVFLASRARARVDCLMAVASVAGYFVFLSFTPTGLRPLKFVEQLPRYLLILTPFLAIGAGGMLAEASRLLAEGGLRRSAIAASAVAVVTSVAIYPDAMLADSLRFRTLDLAGLKKCLRQIDARETPEVVLPWEYRQLVPASYLSYGVKLGYLTRKPDNPQAGPDRFGDVREFVSRAAPGQALFIPIAPLGPSPTDKEVVIPEDIQQDAQIDGLLAAGGYQRELVEVPRSSFFAWLNALGVKSKGKYVGCLYRRTGPPGGRS